MQCNKAEELTSQQIDAMVKQRQAPTTTTPLPQDNREFGFVSAAAAAAVASAETSRTMKTTPIQNGFPDANNVADDGVYKTTIRIAANERNGIASGVVAPPTTTSYDASEAYSLNNQNDYGDGDDNDDDDYYDYNQDTKENDDGEWNGEPAQCECVPYHY